MKIIKKKRIVLATLSVVIATVCSCCSVSHESIGGKAADNKAVDNGYGQLDEKIYKGQFKYVLGGISPDIKTDYYYSDGYFVKSGKECNAHLRTMSMNLALAVTPSPGGEKDQNILQLMQEIGFQDIICEDMQNETTKDTIGSAISHKNMNGTEVIAVAIRGDGYEAEWASNMMIGRSGDEEGFSSASQKIVNRIKEYQENYHLKHIKIWISGYSRAGGVANLTGKYIIEHLEEFDINHDDDVYVYTFEAPNSSADDVIYDSIHNVINVNDLIPYLPFEKWGLYSNGQKEYIGNDMEITIKSTTILKEQMKKDKKNKEETKKDAKESAGDGTDTVSMTAFLSETADWLADTIDREEGAKSMDHVSKLIELSYIKTPDELKELIAYFKLVGQSIVNDTSKTEWAKLILAFSLSGSGIKVDVTAQLADLITDHMEIVKGKNGISCSEEEYVVFKESVLPLLNLLQPIISSDSPDFTHLMTLADNSFTIIGAHITTVNLALLQKEDSYFNEKVEVYPIEEME